MQQENSHKSSSNLRILILLLVCITAGAVSVTVGAVFFRKTVSTMLTPDSVPVKTEAYADSVKDESNEEKMKSELGGGSISMAYRKTVTISLAEKTVKLMFQNPVKSVNGMVLQLAVVSSDGEEIVIAQSDLIKPGNEITRMDLIDEEGFLWEGSYKGKFNVFCYAPDSGEKSIVDGSVEGISITVTQ